MTPSAGGAAHRMSYVDYLNQFHSLNQLEPFDIYERVLYYQILAFFNDRRRHNVWRESERFADPFLCMATGIKSVNSLKKARAGLVARGLLSFEGGHHGAGKMGEYRLLQVAEDPAEKLSQKPSLKLSSDDSLNDSFSTAEAEKLSPKLSGKLSPNDTNYQITEVTENVTERELTPLEKKIAEHVFSDPNGADEAPHTGGGAAGPQPLQEGEQPRGGFVDAALADEDPRKWEARPRDVEMIDEYLRNHFNPEIRKHAGKGHLFWEQYAPVGWVKGRNNTPIMNWRALIPSFSFIDYKAQKAAEAAAKSGSKVEQRQDVAAEARAMLRAQKPQQP